MQTALVLPAASRPSPAGRSGPRRARGVVRRLPPAARPAALRGSAPGEPCPELPGGVLWTSAPSMCTIPGVDFSAAVTGRGDNFIILGTSSLQRTTEEVSLQRLDMRKGQQLVLSSAVGKTPVSQLTDFTCAKGEVIEIELVGSDNVEKPSADERPDFMALVMQATLGPAAQTKGLGAPPFDSTPEHKDEPNTVFGSNSPRRTQPVQFTCNICKTRTTRVVNPRAWTHGTVFLECSGCKIKHKAVDNLNLFHELTGPVFPEAKPMELKTKHGILRNLSWKLEKDTDGETEH